MSRRTVVVAGASGVIGQAAAEHFARGGFGQVIGISRREPNLPPSLGVKHLPLDLLDADACRNAAPQLAQATHLVFAALFEKPGLVAGWYEEDQMATNLAMLKNLMEPLLQAAPDLRHVSVLQGTKAYGAHVHAISVPARESWPRDPHANFYWLQEDYLRGLRRDANWSLTVWRPQVVFGTATGAAMNIIPVLGAYAAIQRELGRPLAFPGRPGGVAEAVSADLVAQALLWAAEAPQAADETFNVTNGDVFTWEGVWPAIAAALKMEATYAEPFSIAQYLMDHADVWDRIVEREGLLPLSLPQLVGESHHYADLLFGVDAPADAARAPVLVSTIKLRQAGFGDCEDTERMFARLLGDIAHMGIVPRAR
ncbi:SDR family oxidoreductase [Novosphingobium sp. ZN18A2]|uniref:SDR family oxidoreductase n=1 Tax=Novosphingobium sp. ZN18A2 TaxID=3079861 RepID=UPI0030D40176